VSRLDGKVLMATGATRGIGLAAAERLATTRPTPPGGSGAPRRSPPSWPSCSDEARFVTGATLPVDGGSTAG
jgi:NAD(P)-dependent dehydrogenase (short-subunit alcohol dehydrogenase family)